MRPAIIVRSTDGQQTWQLPRDAEPPPIPRIGEALHHAWRADIWRVVDVVYRWDRHGCYEVLVMVEPDGAGGRKKS